MTPAMEISFCGSSPRRRKVCGSGFISKAVAVSTTFMLRSFSRYLSMGWPETKKPRTSFSFWRRVCSSHSATLGRASSPLWLAEEWMSASKMPKRPCWPAASSRCDFWARSMALSSAAVELRAAAEGVHGSGLDEGLEDALVEEAKVDFFAELPEAGEALLPCCLHCGACGDDGFDGVVADVLDGGEAEADGLPLGVTIGVKLASETWTLGGTTGMFISRHSEMYLTTLSGLEVSLVSSAAMNSTG